MATEYVMVYARTGMAVHSADGHLVGTVARIWYGSDPAPCTTPEHPWTTRSCPNSTSCLAASN
jgi:hypothetical protein